jgi:organic radical activating enzyme
MNRIKLKSAEYNIVEHCNLRCAGCDHASPVMAKTFIALKEFEDDLLAFSKYISVGTFKLLGGEATLHPEIIDFMKTAKSIGFSDKLCIITNGTALHKMEEEFWQLLDLLQVTFYPNVAVPISRTELIFKANKYGFELEMEDKARFRNTILDKKNENAELVKKVYTACELHNTYACHTIRHGKFYKCSPASFTDDRLNKIDVSHENENDFISLHSEHFSVSQIEKYMSDTEPMPSCAYCLGTCGTFFDHYQLPIEIIKKQRSVSVVSTDSDITTLIDFSHLNQRLSVIDKYITVD